MPYYMIRTLMLIPNYTMPLLYQNSITEYSKLLEHSLLYYQDPYAYAKLYHIITIPELYNII